MTDFVKIIIDGQYADITWNALELDGGLVSFLTPPETKDPISNESDGLHGKQVLNSRILLKDRNISVPMYFKGEQGKENYESLLFLLKQGNTTLSLGYVGEAVNVCNVRYVNSTNLRIFNNGIVATLVFNEFDPSIRQKRIV